MAVEVAAPASATASGSEASAHAPSVQARAAMMDNLNPGRLRVTPYPDRHANFLQPAPVVPKDDPIGIPRFALLRRAASALPRRRPGGALGLRHSARRGAWLRGAP